jgi:hypothetical protein
MIALRTTVDRATADLVAVVKTIADLVAVVRIAAGPVAAEGRTRKGT